MKKTLSILLAIVLMSCAVGCGNVNVKPERFADASGNIKTAFLNKTVKLTNEQLESEAYNLYTEIPIPSIPTSGVTDETFNIYVGTYLYEVIFGVMKPIEEPRTYTSAMVDEYYESLVESTDFGYDTESGIGDFGYYISTKNNNGWVCTIRALSDDTDEGFLVDFIKPIN